MFWRGLLPYVPHQCDTVTVRTGSKLSNYAKQSLSFIIYYSIIRSLFPSAREEAGKKRSLTEDFLLSEACMGEHHLILCCHLPGGSGRRGTLYYSFVIHYSFVKPSEQQRNTTLLSNHGRRYSPFLR
jgi:hypothetical protein